MLGSRTALPPAAEPPSRSVCKSYGIKLIRIANSQVKDYEMIIALFECVIQGLPDIEEVYRQGLLFGEEGTEGLPA